MKKTKKKLEKYWDMLIYKKLPPVAKFKKVNKELIEHFNLAKWSLKRILLPIIIFYIIFSLLLNINVFGALLTSLLIFFYSNFLPDVDILFEKTKKQSLDSPWYEKYAVLFFAPVILYDVLLGRQRKLYSLKERPFHSLETLGVYAVFLFVVASVFWPDVPRKLLFVLSGILGYSTHLLTDLGVIRSGRQ